MIHPIPYEPNPTISAYAGICGAPYDFRAHPLAPLGAHVLIHDKPANRDLGLIVEYQAITLDLLSNKHR